jgi:hypothetical protein
MQRHAYTIEKSIWFSGGRIRKRPFESPLKHGTLITWISGARGGIMRDGLQGGIIPFKGSFCRDLIYGKGRLMEVVFYYGDEVFVLP